MSEKNFFKRQTDSSKIKAYIVSEYFPQYCRIIRKKHEPRMFRYIDLFAGPGIYEDGNESTPILIGRNVAADSTLKDKVQLVFNDLYFKDDLKENFESEFPSGTFGQGVYFSQYEVGKSQEVYNFLERNTMIDGKNEKPSLLFFDPFGYKGMNTEVLARFLKNWGNEIFLFINTKRINPALENEKFEDLVRLWFPTRYDDLKERIRQEKTVSDRLEYIISNLADEFKALLKTKYLYCIAFRFQEEDINTTSHYILHITKGAKGFELAKSVYDKFANEDLVLRGSNTYTFDPKKCMYNETLFGNLDEAVNDLKQLLYFDYSGKTVAALDLFINHQIRTRYSRKHYISALRKLVADKKIVSTFVDGKQHKVTVLLSKDCMLTFK